MCNTRGKIIQLKRDTKLTKWREKVKTKQMSMSAGSWSIWVEEEWDEENNHKKLCAQNFVRSFHIQFASCEEWNP